MKVSILLVAMLALVACETQNAKESAPGAFDGEAARGYVKTQLDFGARVPGTEAHRAAGDWIVTMMRERADTVIEQRWTHVTTQGDSLPLRNIFARFRPEATERVLYLTHWDSRPRSESARDEAQRALPVPGANDGASGTAMFVALGDLWKKAPPGVGVDLLFVDGEDWGTFNPDVDVLIGATYFADHPIVADYTPIFGVLWDMIGDKDLRIPQEEHSMRGAPEVVQRVWQKAADLGYGQYFVQQSQGPVTDDHLPLLKKGLRVINVIDLSYPYHHTPEDTFDKVSAKSLKIVGDVADALVR